MIRMFFFIVVSFIVSPRPSGNRSDQHGELFFSQRRFPAESAPFSLANGDVRNATEPSYLLTGNLLWPW